MKKTFFKYAVIIITIFFSTEFFTRIFFPIYFPVFIENNGTEIKNILIPDDYLHHKLRPNLSGKFKSSQYSHNFKTDSLGFRGFNDYGISDPYSF
ncbi:MAG: hypothetical protein O7F74_08915, partial [Bacteroidetes bacterium]|nr:hypothetical protein [Bacteroidota bacterium]